MLGAVLRCWHLGELPAGLNRDEAAIAYNGWLLAQTGRDEWGRMWPLFLESFGDQKLPGYPYLVALLFRLHYDQWLAPDTMVRLPSVLAGVALIAIAFALAQLFGKQKTGLCPGVVTAFLVECNPIFIWYSRGALEANVSLCWWFLAVYLIAQKLMQKNSSWTVRRLVVIFVLLMASFLTYNAPLLITGVALGWWLWVAWPRGVKFWAPLLVVMTVTVVGTFSLLAPVTAQKGGITIFDDPTVQYHYTIYRENLNPLIVKLFGSKYAYLSGIMLRSGLASLAPRFWWHGNSHPWHQLRGFGYVNLTTSVLIYVSLIYLLGMMIVTIWRERGHGWWRCVPLQVLVLIAIMLAPSVITTDAPHATRSLEFFAVLVIVAGVVVGELFGKVFEYKMYTKKAIIILVCFSAIFACEVANYSYHYVVDLPKMNIYHAGFERFLPEWDTKRPVLVRTNESKYEYIKWAWALRVEPELFWRTIVWHAPDTAGIKGASDLLNFHFQDPDEDNLEYSQAIWYNTETESWERLR